MQTQALQTLLRGAGQPWSATWTGRVHTQPSVLILTSGSLLSWVSGWRSGLLELVFFVVAYFWWNFSAFAIIQSFRFVYKYWSFILLSVKSKSCRVVYTTRPCDLRCCVRFQMLSFPVPHRLQRWAVPASCVCLTALERRWTRWPSRWMRVTK